MKRETTAGAVVSAERIEKGLWWEKPWSLVDGCTPVSEACDHCWSARDAARWPRSRRLTTDGRFNGQVWVRRDRLEIPLKRRKPTVWAVWCDLFHEKVPTDFIWQALNVMAETPRHTYIVLTKRAERMRDVVREMLAGSKEDALRGNIWPGVTAENQARAEERIPALLATPAVVRVVSVEPMLGGVSLFDGASSLAKDIECRARTEKPYGFKQKIGWVICGGESGGGARPMHPEGPRSLREQCQAAGVPFFFKQWGEWSPEQTKGRPVVSISPAGLDVTAARATSPGDAWMYRVGKKAAGRLLDGRTWDEFPATAGSRRAAEDAEAEE